MKVDATVMKVEALVSEVDATVWKSTPRFASRRLGLFGSRRHGLGVDATVRKSTPLFGSRRYGMEVDVVVSAVNGVI